VQIQIFVIDAKNGAKLMVAGHLVGQQAVRHVVQTGQKITLVVDGVTLTGAQAVAQKRVKLVRVGQDLVVETIDGSDKLVELARFHAEQDVVLTGDQWVLAEGSQLQQLSEGVALLPFTSVTPVFSTLSVANAAVTQAVGSTSWVGNVMGGIVGGSIGLQTIRDLRDEPLPKETSREEEMSTLDTQGPGQVSVAVPEAASGINAVDAAIGGGVLVVVTLPADAAEADVISVSIDGGTPVSYTVTADDINLALNAGGTVSVLLPTWAITAAGDGVVSITTIYTDVAGNASANSPIITTGISIDTLPPTAPVVNVLTTNDTTPTITGIATLQAGESLTVVVNGATYNDVAVNGSGQWTLDTGSATVNSGTLGTFVMGISYSVLATITDSAANSTSDASSNEITMSLAQVTAVTNNGPVNEGSNLVATVNMDTTAGNSAVAFSLGGTAGAADYGTRTFSNGVTVNGNGTLNVPTGVSSFTITTTTVADVIIEGAETVIFNVGGQSTTATIQDVDLTPPQLVSAAPADNSSAVAVSSDIVFTFNDPIAVGTGFVRLRNLSDNTESTIDITDASQVSISGNTLTINPTANLAGQKNYAVQIDAGAITDLNGNGFAGISNDQDLNFATKYVAGQDVISLGNLGYLIAPVQVEGNWYYVWSGAFNGTADLLHGTAGDGFDMTYIETTFFGGTQVSETNRDFSLNGVDVRIPTLGGPLHGGGLIFSSTASPGTSYDANKPGATQVNVSTPNDNSTYNDFYAIWDGINGSGAANNTALPSGWAAEYYWTATPHHTGSDNFHLFLFNGSTAAVDQNQSRYLALQVL
jgi:hypothetical protein